MHHLSLFDLAMRAPSTSDLIRRTLILGHDGVNSDVAPRVQ